jgi:hypothetical protein
VTSAGRLTLAVASLGVLAGVLSLPSSVLMFAGVSSPAAIGIASIAVVAASFAGVLWTARRAGASPASSIRSGRAAVIPAVALLAIAAATGAVYFVSVSAIANHGEWDAWAQWNLRARFFHRGLADGAWRQSLEPVLAWSHPDYPLLVPSSVAALWWLGGRETVAAPIGLAALFTACVAGLIGCSLAGRKGAAVGCVGAAAILASPAFVRWGPSQCADIPLAFFMLAAFVLWQDGHGFLAGLSAGLAGWTKNEGEVFLLVFLLIVAIAEVRAAGRQGASRWAVVLAGALPAILVTAYFKYALAPQSYFAGQTQAALLARVFEWDRIVQVVRTLGRELWSSGGAPVGVIPIVVSYLIVRGVDRAHSPAVRWAAIASVLMTCAYVGAYLATPLDLTFQLQTSADRVVLHLQPLIVWSALNLAA